MEKLLGLFTLWADESQSVNLKGQSGLSTSAYPVYLDRVQMTPDTHDD